MPDQIFRLPDGQADDFHGDLAYIADRLDALVAELKRFNDRPLFVSEGANILIFDQEAKMYRAATILEQQAMNNLSMERAMEQLKDKPQPEPVALPKVPVLTHQHIVSLITDQATRDVGFKAALTVEPSKEVLDAVASVRDDQDSLDARNLMDRYPHEANIPFLIDRLVREQDDRRVITIQNTLYALGEAAVKPLEQAAMRHFDNRTVGRTLVAQMATRSADALPALTLAHIATSCPNKHARIAAIMVMIEGGNQVIVDLVFDEKEDVDVRRAVAEQLSAITLQLPIYPHSQFSSYD